MFYELSRPLLGLNFLDEAKPQTQRPHPPPSWPLVTRRVFGLHGLIISNAGGPTHHDQLPLPPAGRCILRSHTLQVSDRHPRMCLPLGK